MSTTPATTPTTRQVMLSLAYLAYTGDLITLPNPERTILGLLKTAMADIPVVENWNVVWGPQTYTTPGALYQDYMMYVAQNSQDPTQYAVAIRGTNAISDLDWLMGDLDVLQMMAWPPGNGGYNPETANISESTSIDLQALLGMTSTLYGDELNPSPKSLIEYLYSQTTNKINLCITGHSLGGCVAGTLALYLKQRMNFWDASRQSIVSCVTFAAPTAGDDTFAKLSDKAFAGGPYPPNWDTSLGTTFDAVRCSLDVAPLAWVASNMTASSFNLYEASADTDPQIDFNEMYSDTDVFVWTTMAALVMGGVQSYLQPLGYTQTVASSSALVGSINPTYAFTGLKNGSNPQESAGIEATLKMFVAQAVWQHSGSYPTILDVPQLVPSGQEAKSSLIVEDPANPAATKKDKGKLLALALANLLNNGKELTTAEK